MSEIEGISQYNPELRTGEERPKWITLSKTIFPEKSLGYSLFPEKLEGRSRPQPVLGKEIDRFLLPSIIYRRKSPKSVIFKRMDEQNIKTVADILALQEEDLNAITVKKGIQRKIKEDLKHYLERQIIPPHGRLIESLYQITQYPVPPEQEQVLIDAVEKSVNELKNPRDRRILIDRFGLHDGIAKAHFEIASRYGGYHNAKAIETRALRNIHGLSGYTTTPEESVARRAFNAVFYKDLQVLSREMRAFSIDLSNLSDSAKQELPKIYHLLRQSRISLQDNLVNTWELLQVDLQKAGVSQETQEEISQKVADFASRLAKRTT